MFISKNHLITRKVAFYQHKHRHSTSSEKSCGLFNKWTTGLNKFVINDWVVAYEKFEVNSLALEEPTCQILTPYLA